jgi:hypothetical protein
MQILQRGRQEKVRYFAAFRTVVDTVAEKCTESAYRQRQRGASCGTFEHR